MARPPRARLRVLFAGSPGIAAPCLRALARGEGGVDLAGVLTNPGTPRGRGRVIAVTEVAAAAEAINRERAAVGLAPVAVLTPESLDGRAREAAAALGADLLVSFAYGRIFGPRFLGVFPLGGINVHPSLLPRYRGPSPIQAAILNRDRETGVTIQRLAAEMDAGAILAQEFLPLEGTETAASLGAAAGERAAAMLPGVLAAIASGTAVERSQSGEVSYCRILAKGDGRLDWGAAAVDVDARVRAFNPWPLAFTSLGGRQLIIHEGRVAPPEAGAGGAAPGTALGGTRVDRPWGILVQTGEGVYGVTRLQWQGRKALDWRAFLNGSRGVVGERLGGDA